MTTTRALRDEITNILDYLLSVDLVVYYNPVSMDGNRVSWVRLNPQEPFLSDRGEPTIGTYRHWVRSSAYSALLFDGALLQVTYTIDEGVISGHRLAYVPCPYRLDSSLVREEPILDLIDVYMEGGPSEVVLHSTMRFDYDPDNAAPGHPSAHLTLNSPDCRIACSAPMHVGRFVDFIFRSFYGKRWRSHSRYFKSIAKNIGGRVITEEDLGSPHIHWT